MKVHAIALAAGMLAAHTGAHAWFIFLPIGAIQNAVQGAHCVAAHSKPGDPINVGGRMWSVVENNGPSSRCSQFPAMPNIAKLEPYFTPEQLKTAVQACLPQGAAVGQRTTLPGVGDVEVQEIMGDACSDTSKPVSVRVMRVKGLDLIRQDQARPRLQPVAQESTQPPPQQQQQRGTADRLRELKQLRDENLITQEVYESKQREILATQ